MDWQGYYMMQISSRAVLRKDGDKIKCEPAVSQLTTGLYMPIMEQVGRESMQQLCTTTYKASDLGSLGLEGIKYKCVKLINNTKDKKGNIIIENLSTFPSSFQKMCAGPYS
jgi:hypothetical protein